MTCFFFIFNAWQEAIDSAFIPTDPMTKVAKLYPSAVIEASSPACVSGWHIDVKWIPKKRKIIWAIIFFVVNTPHWNYMGHLTGGLYQSIYPRLWIEGKFVIPFWESGNVCICSRKPKLDSCNPVLMHRDPVFLSLMVRQKGILD